MQIRLTCFSLSAGIMAIVLFLVGMHYFDTVSHLKEKNEQLSRKVNVLESEFLTDLEKGEFEVTAYDVSLRSTGKWSRNHLTKSGTTPHRYRTVAVDPTIIPIGSLVYIEGVGWRIAEDTGSKIKGKMIDVFFDSEDEAIDFGRQTLKVYYYKV
ncbi:MAG: 3D domain-containing protein [Nitrospirae bacterium]|nr:3D domain-containing protein [Nitrospirota bacterium]MBF0535394.1 3D domain-containing protein [Nitrospirota bacterium]MBF0616914.1 3D domain-containing protein [Nitrospirota bacterium]